MTSDVTAAPHPGPGVLRPSCACNSPFSMHKLLMDIRVLGGVAQLKDREQAWGQGATLAALSCACRSAICDCSAAHLAASASRSLLRSASRCAAAASASCSCALAAVCVLPFSCEVAACGHWQMRMGAVCSRLDDTAAVRIGLPKVER